MRDEFAPEIFQDFGDCTQPIINHGLIRLVGQPRIEGIRHCDQPHMDFEQPRQSATQPLRADTPPRASTNRINYSVASSIIDKIIVQMYVS